MFFGHSHYQPLRESLTSDKPVPRDQAVDHTVCSRACVFPAIIVSVAVTFMAVSILIIVALYTVPVPLPKAEVCKGLLQEIEIVHQPLVDLMVSVRNITATLGRTNVFGNALITPVNTTLVLVDDFINRDEELVRIVTDFLEGFTYFITGLDKSIIGFIIDDAFVSELKNLTQACQMLMPDLVLMRKQFKDIDSNLVGFMSAFDMIYRRMVPIADKTISLQAVIDKAFSMVSMVSTTSTNAIRVWPMTKFAFAMCCVVVFFVCMSIALCNTIILMKRKG